MGGGRAKVGVEGKSIGGGAASVPSEEGGGASASTFAK